MTPFSHIVTSANSMSSTCNTLLPSDFLMSLLFVALPAMEYELIPPFLIWSLTLFDILVSPLNSEIKNSPFSSTPLLNMFPFLLMYAGSACPTCTSECITITFLALKFFINFLNAFLRASVVIKCPSLSTNSTDAGPPTTIGSEPSSSSISSAASVYVLLLGKALCKVITSAGDANPAS